MTLIVAHHKTQQEAIGIVDRGASGLFAGVAGDVVEIVDQKKEWNGSTMTFSFTGKLGFIAAWGNQGISPGWAGIAAIWGPIVQPHSIL